MAMNHEPLEMPTGDKYVRAFWTEYQERQKYRREQEAAKSFPMRGIAWGMLGGAICWGLLWGTVWVLRVLF